MAIDTWTGGASPRWEREPRAWTTPTMPKPRAAEVGDGNLKRTDQTVDRAAQGSHEQILRKEMQL
jgi:hypothetical protein